MSRQAASTSLEMWYLTRMSLLLPHCILNVGARLRAEIKLLPSNLCTSHDGVCTVDDIAQPVDSFNPMAGKILLRLGRKNLKELGLRIMRYQEMAKLILAWSTELVQVLSPYLSWIQCMSCQGLPRDLSWIQCQVCA
jgi:hypothetical protein